MKFKSYIKQKVYNKVIPTTQIKRQNFANPMIACYEMPLLPNT